MIRVKICIGIMAFLILFSLSSLFFIDNRCDKLTNQLNIIYSYQKNNETEKAISEIEKLDAIWQKDYKALRCLFRHDKIFELNSSIARLKDYASDSNDELGGEIRSALHYLDMLKQSEFPYIYNIL